MVVAPPGPTKQPSLDESRDVYGTIAANLNIAGAGLINSNSLQSSSGGAHKSLNLAQMIS